MQLANSVERIDHRSNNSATRAPSPPTTTSDYETLTYPGLNTALDAWHRTTSALWAEGVAFTEEYVQSRKAVVEGGSQEDVLRGILHSYSSFHKSWPLGYPYIFAGFIVKSR